MSRVAVGGDAVVLIERINVVLLDKALEGDSELAQVVDALDLLGLAFGLGHGGREQGGEDGNDGDDDEEFDEGERGGASQSGIWY
jgi:hypothetical protein